MTVDDDPTPAGRVAELEHEAAAARAAFERQHGEHLAELRAGAEEFERIRGELEQEQARSAAAERRAVGLERELDREKKRSAELEQRLQRIQSSRAYRIGTRIAALARPFRRQRRGHGS